MSLITSQLAQRIHYFSLQVQSSNRVNNLWRCLFPRNPLFHRPFNIFWFLLLIVTFRDQLLLQHLGIGFKFQLSAKKFFRCHTAFHCKTFFTRIPKNKSIVIFQLPITHYILISVLRALEHTISSFFRKCLLRLVFLWHFCAFLRKNLWYNTHLILFKNVAIKLDAQHWQYIEMSFHHFKYAKPSTSILRLQQNKTDSNLCPHKSLMQYVRIRKHELPSQPLFSLLDISISRQFFYRKTLDSFITCNIVTLIFNTTKFMVSESVLPPLQLPEVDQNSKSKTWGMEVKCFKEVYRISTL